MKLYLIQHGDSVSKEIDPDRPLSTQGRHDIEHLADFLKKTGMSVGKIMHSGKTRARQTAEILAAGLSDNGGIAAVNGIAPNDPVESFAVTIPTLETGTVIVGHLPFMARLVSFLVTSDIDQPLVDYRPGSIVCLEQNASLNWQIQWMIRPDCL
jgi:phosphohistidine phosphatase